MKVSRTRIIALGSMSLVLALSAGAVFYVREKLIEIDIRLSRLQAYAETLSAEESIGSRLVSEERLTSAVANATPAVVSIIVSKQTPQFEIVYVNPFGDDDSGFRIPTLRREGLAPRQVGAGSGFLISAQGYIVTNKHVVDDTDASYTIVLSDGEERRGEIVYRDEDADIAIVKIEGEEHPFLPLGNSDTVQIGQTVFAVGNALGEYGNSVSVGIVSGLDRTVEAFGEGGRELLEGVIQTDAAINLGNSGGPLLGLDGRVVGVNVAIARGSENIAFSIPINVVREVIARAL